MSITAGPDPLETGLVFCVDAANPRSYSVEKNTLSDSTFNAVQPGVVSNGVTYTSSGPQSYLTFSGVNRTYITFGDSTLKADATDKTFCAWIYPTSYTGIDTQPMGLLDKDQDDVNGQGGWGFWLSNTGKLWFWPASAADIKDTSGILVALNTWTFVSMVWNRTEKSCKFYFNGVYAATGTTTVADQGSLTSANLVIGTLRNNPVAPSWHFTGRMSHIALYNRTLTDAEILQNFNVLRTRYGI